MPYSSATTIGNWNEERAWRETGSEAPLSARAFGRRAPLSAEEELQRNKGHHPSHITNWERDDVDRQTRTEKLPTAAHDRVSPHTADRSSLVRGWGCPRRAPLLGWV